MRIIPIAVPLTGMAGIVIIPIILTIIIPIVLMRGDLFITPGDFLQRHLLQQPLFSLWKVSNTTMTRGFIMHPVVGDTR